MSEAAAGPAEVAPQGEPPQTHPGPNYSDWEEHSPDVRRYPQWNSVWEKFSELEELQLYQCVKMKGDRNDPKYSFSGHTVSFSGPAKILTEYKSPAQRRDGKRACTVEEGQGEQEAPWQRRKRGKGSGQRGEAAGAPRSLHVDEERSERVPFMPTSTPGNVQHNSSQELHEASQPGAGGAWQPATHGGQQMVATPDAQELQQAGMEEQSLEDVLLAANDQEVQEQQCEVDKLSQELQHQEEACKNLEARKQWVVKLQAFLDTAQEGAEDCDASESTRAAAAQVLAKHKAPMEDERKWQQAAQAAAQRLPALSQDLESAKERLKVLTTRRAAARMRWKAFNELQRQQGQ